MIIVNWHKRFTEWFQKKSKVSNYAMMWISWSEGLGIGMIIGLLVYHFLF